LVANATADTLTGGMARLLRLATFALALLAAPLAAEAQQGDKVYRVGHLSSLDAPTVNHEALREGLRQLGWIEGKTLIIENRFAGPDRDRLAAAAADLVHLPVDLIVTTGGVENDSGGQDRHEEDPDRVCHSRAG
jgi:putative tryptophan/tyrosine transport system substrate-binding protein